MALMASLDEVLQQIPLLAGPGIAVSDLPGGLTNTNHKITTPTGAYVVRRWNEESGLLSIDRDNEHQNSVRAAAAGVGAEVIAYLPSYQTMVVAFIEGETMSADALRRGDHLPAIAAACRRLHAAERFRDDFDMFEIQRQYLARVLEHGFRLPDRYHEFAPHAAAIHDAFAVRQEATVPCNNDLLAENFILTADGFRLIDYEYSGNNEPSFELGNIWSESNLPLNRLPELVTAYYGRPLRHKVARARLWGLMAKYGWTLWASIKDGTADGGFDFWGWGMEKYRRAVEEFESPDFERLLDEVRRPD